VAETELSVGVIVLVAATVQSATGFGYAVLAAPLLSIVLDPAEALPLVWLTFVPAAAAVTVLLRADVCWAIGWRASFAGVPAALLGGWALADVPSRVLQALTGLSILVFTLVRAPRRTSVLPTQATDALAGAIAGLLAVTTGTSGPPLVLAVSRHVLSPAQARATLAWLFTVFGLTAVTWLQLTGHMPTQSRGLLLAALPPLAAGTFLGLFLGRHLPSRVTVTATRLLLLGSALACLAKAAAG
jgi:hypothetical protein